MPAPAVYVIAVVGSVGVAIAFKEFIYPHIAPRIDRWKSEFQAARKRRAEAERSAVMAEVALIQRGAGKDGHQDSDSDSDHSDVGLGKGTPTSAHPYMKNGLLIRRWSRSETKPGDVELDWITGTSTAIEMGSQHPDSRLNTSSLNEQMQPIQHTPFLPPATNIRTSNEDSSQMKSSHKPIELELNKTTESHAFLDKSIQVIPYTPLSPIQRPTPTSLPSPSSPPALALSSPSQLLSPTRLHPSPYQAPHAIPSLSQSYPLDDLLDYEHGLELLSPPSPLSRTDSPFELAGLSPRPGLTERSTLLLARSGDSGGQFSAAPFDSMTNSTRSTTYLSLSSPTLSASSVFLSSENGYENDSSPSEISSTFSSPSVAPTRLGDIGSESSSPHDQARLSRSISPLSSRSSLSYDVNHRRQQPERTEWASMRVSVPAFSAPTARPQESDARRPMATNEYDYADTQTLSPRNRTRSPGIMKRTVTDSIVTTSVSTEIHPLGSATRLSKMSDSDFDTGSELSDLDFLNMSAEEYKASTSAAAGAAGSVGLGSRSVVYTSADGGSGVLGRAGGIGGTGIRDGNESDTSSWSLAGGSD